MLNERIDLSHDGFQVRAEAGTGRELRYGTYSFRNEPDYIPKKLIKGKYYANISEPNENRFDAAGTPNDQLLYVSETENGHIVEEHRLCIKSRLVTVSGRKRRLNITFGKAPLFFGGKRSMISFEWEDWDKIPINAGYFNLVAPDKQRYPFLCDVIQPQITKGGLEPDRFIFELKEGFSFEDYDVLAAPLLREKYKIRKCW